MYQTKRTTSFSKSCERHTGFCFITECDETKSNKTPCNPEQNISTVDVEMPLSKTLPH